MMLLSAASVAAQDTRLIQGRVVDAGSGVPIAGATVVALDVSHAAALTSAAGVFTLRVRGAAVALVGARLGYSPDTVQLARDGDITMRLQRAPIALDAVVAGAVRGYTAASSRAVRELDLQLRPRESSQDLLRLAPGLVIAQHAGGGKAEQIFLRGFDADHGTDVAIAVDGTPVNLVSHAHGQGYADLHFLIPEVVERIDVRKGPYDARDGDFATAGAISFRTRDRIPHAAIHARGGSFSTSRLLVTAPFGGDATQSGGYIAAAGHYGRGPFDEPQGHRRLNLFTRWTAPVSDAAELVATASAYHARWDASGQIPERAVESGAIGRFGAIDASEGGDTERHDISIGIRSRTGADRWEARAFAARYRLDLFSNFTFFLNDSIDGDGIEQLDDRWLAGVHAELLHPSALAGRPAALRAGAGARNDWADAGLHAQRERVRTGTYLDSRITQTHLFGWTTYDIAPSDRLRVQFGVRGDAFRFAVRDLVADASAGDRLVGAAWRAVVSPKTSLAYDVAPMTTLFLNAAAGFHSNDARDVVQASPGERVLPRAVGAELGARHDRRSGTIAAALWLLDLQSELVFVGDEGTTEPSGRTRRAGVDLEMRLRLLDWLWADADVNLARGRFRDEPAGADRIPLAPALTATGGLTARDAGRASGGLRMRAIGSRPADEKGDVTARGAALWEAFAAWNVGRLRLHAAIDNLFDVTWNEAQFATTSRLRNEAAPVTELHFTPGAPRTLMAGIEYRF